MIKAVIFDMDGTMLDTEILDQKAWQEAGKQLGYDIKTETLIKMIGLSWEKGKAILLEAFTNHFDYDAVHEAKDNYIEQYIVTNGVPMKKGLLEILHYLKEKGYKIGVATSTKREKVESHLKGIDILKYFDIIVCGDEIENGKPAPDIFLKTCKLLKVKPEEALVLEDSYNGILGAYRAKTKTIMIPDLIPSNEELEKMYTKKVESLLDVIEVLEKNEI